MISFKEWEKRGRYLEVNGHRLFVIDEGRQQETLAILHGFPSCGYDFWKVLPRLSQQFRVVIHDHPGFGLSEKPIDYSYSLIEQADHALMLWQQLGISSAHLLAHDYGTSIATEIIARHNRGEQPIEIQSVTLTNGSMLINMAQLRPIQRALRNRVIGPLVAKLSSEKVFIRNMKKIWGDPRQIDLEELKVLWQMLIHNDGRAVLPQISRYTCERLFFWHRWIGALEQTDLPVNILWADQDPVAVIQMADVLHEKIARSQLRKLVGIGHYPMLEAPEQWGDALLEMIEKIGSI